jgi:hypothetical protein
VSPGFREELEALRDGGPVDGDTLRRVALAALAFVPPDELVQAVGRCWGLGNYRVRPGHRLVILDQDGVEIEDLTPNEGWQR